MLRDHTSLQVGGPARNLVRIGSRAELVEALQHFDDRSPAALLLLGGGTNVVLSDDGFDATVLVLSGGEMETHEDTDGYRFTLDAGVSWDAFVAKAVDLGCTGVEMMSGIPGCVGAAPIQNIAAYGQQVCDVIESVEVIDRSSLGLDELSANACGFGFRSSRFKTEWADRFVITRVSLRLPRATDALPAASGYVDIQRYFERHDTSPVDVAARRDAVLATRRSKSMLLDPNDPDARSAGSFFVNPTVPTELAISLAERFDTFTLRVQYLEGNSGAVADHQRVPAAILLRASGFNPGDSWGPVRLSSKHVLAIVTTAEARATDVWNVANHIRARVHDEVGVSLEYEPTFIGNFPAFDASAFATAYTYEPAPAVEPSWLQSYR